MIRRDKYNLTDSDSLARDVLCKTTPTYAEEAMAYYIVDNKIIDRIEKLEENDRMIEEMQEMLDDVDKYNETELRSVLKEVRNALDFLWCGE